MFALNPVVISGREVWPIVEGGKGVSVSNGESAGAFADSGCVGTFSAVNADAFDEDGRVIPQVYHGSTRRDRYEELIAYAIHGGIFQAQRAHERAGGRGRIHMNVLWEAAATPRIVHGILEGAKGLVHGITCGAGMPYRIAEIVAEYGLYYYPIISSARAFRALWKRSYHKYAELLGGVVYEDPWLAGGHNGLSNSEDPNKPEDPLPRVRDLRRQMRACGLDNTPIFMAGGVWNLREWEEWIGNPELEPIVFQFGTRPVVTKESPVSEEWKRRLLTLREGDVHLHRFSPTGFYSSAVRNDFLVELIERNERHVEYVSKPAGDKTEGLPIGARKRLVYVTAVDKTRAEGWIADGFTEAMRTPDHTLIFVTPESSQQIRIDQQSCMGCLSACRFSNWSENASGTTGKPADPRSFCIQKTLQSVAHEGDIDNNLLFAGHNAYRFATDPFYRDGFIPTVKQLVDR
ncbi:MAG: nitronate monooxygenase, partial [Rhodospirillales bacterium]|nr:nitronate monooxygenase [Rhodospirillales bacterium]